MPAIAGHTIISNLFGKSREKSGKTGKNPGKDRHASEKQSQRGGFGSFRKDSNPDVIYGRDFEGEAIPLESITGEMGEVTQPATVYMERAVAAVAAVPACRATNSPEIFSITG